MLDRRSVIINVERPLRRANVRQSKWLDIDTVGVYTYIFTYRVSQKKLHLVYYGPPNKV